MYRTLDISSVFPFSIAIRLPQVHFVPQSASELVFTLLLLISIFSTFRILRYYISFKSPEDTAFSDTPDSLATKNLNENGDESTVPLSPVSSSLVTSFIELVSSIGAMIVSPLAVRPVPVSEPPSALVERALDVLPKLEKPESPCPVKQPYDSFLVLDVEATCREGTDFNWPNEIIEWPVILLRWRNKDSEGRAKELYVADEFRSFVKPIWRPELSAFCTSLTGITQAQVDRAPKFTKVLESFYEFLLRNKLIDPSTGERLERFIWCTDGPFDIRDFVVKQCFISKVQMPLWLKGDVLDVRKVVTYYLALQEGSVSKRPRPKNSFPKGGALGPRRRTLNIEQQLRVLNLAEFIGRQHSGIDDTRNIARVVVELAKRGIRLEPNTPIYPGRRWQWMGKPGQILEEYCFI
ncbi:hypothetical protein ACEPAG_5042 [Sanghuangporus baumii]